MIVKYLNTSNRRKRINKLFVENHYLFHGVVLDIGGRDRGTKRPYAFVDRWIFADINKNYNPDIVLDVADMKIIKTKSITVVVAMELFEHVKEIEKGLQECRRVLMNNGYMILSIPFMSRVHSDPNDFQRWTLDKWKNVFNDLGFDIENVDINGSYFSVLTDIIKTGIRISPLIFRYSLIIFFPLLHLIKRLDNCKFVKNHKVLSSFHSGYFFVLKKSK